MTATEIQSLPVLHRAFRLERQSVKEDSRQLTMSIADSAECDRYFGVEVLSMEAGAIRLDRLKNGAALLFNHQPDLHLGRLNNPRVEGGKLVVDATFSKSALGEEKYQDALSGVLVDTSIGYIVHAYEVDEADVYRAVDWEPIEASLVTIPASLHTGIGRNADNSTTYPVSIRTRSIMNPTTTTPNENQQQREQREAEIRRAERSRCEEIRAIAKRATGLSETEVEKWINEGRSAEAFRKFVFHNHWGKSQPISTPGELSAMSTSRGMTGDEARSLGAMITRAPEFQTMLRGGKKNVSLDFPHVSNVRALTTGGFGATVESPGVVVAALQTLAISDLLAPGVTGAGTVRYPRENSFTNAADTVAEGSAKPEQTFDLAVTDASVKKIAAFCKVSDELLQDSPGADAYINSRLGWSVLRAEESQIISGDGAGSNMLGILSQSGIQIQAKGADTQVDAIRKAIGKVASATDFSADAIIIHPADWTTIELLKDADGRPLVGQLNVPNEFGQPLRAPSLWSLPVSVSKSMTQGTALVGAFRSAAQLFRRMGLLIEMSNSDGDDFTKNLVTIRAELRAALAVYCPAAFVEVTGL